MRRPQALACYSRPTIPSPRGLLGQAKHRRRRAGDSRVRQPLPEASSFAERIQRGDHAAEEELAAHFHPRVLAMLAVRLRDREAAKDLAQDVILSVLVALREGRLENGDRLAGFIRGTARNLANNHLRVRQRRPTERLPAQLQAQVQKDRLEAAERQTLVQRALARLSNSDRRILLLTLVNGLKPGQIAAHLDLKPEVVRKRKSRALARIRKIVKKKGHELTVKAT